MQKITHFMGIRLIDREMKSVKARAEQIIAKSSGFFLCPFLTIFGDCLQTYLHASHYIANWLTRANPHLKLKFVEPNNVLHNFHFDLVFLLLFSLSLSLFSFCLHKYEFPKFVGAIIEERKKIWNQEWISQNPIQMLNDGLVTTWNFVGVLFWFK